MWDIVCPLILSFPPSVKSCYDRVSFLRYFPGFWQLQALPVGYCTHSHTPDAIWNLFLFTGEGMRNCATKLPAVLQVWISTSPQPWLIAMKSGTFSEDEAITIALTNSINAICQCQEKMWWEKKCWWGQGADRATDLSQLGMLETEGEYDCEKKNFVLSGDRYRTRTFSELITHMQELCTHLCKSRNESQSYFCKV